MKRILIFLFALILLTACSPTATPTQSPDTPVDSNTPPNGLPPIYAPRPGDALLERSEVYFSSADLLAMESFPVQYAILLKGDLPTPCHELRIVINQPDADNRIQLDVYSVTDPAAICVQMIQPFEQNIYLGSLPAGHYTVWIGSEMVVEFDA